MIQFLFLDELIYLDNLFLIEFTTAPFFMILFSILNNLCSFSGAKSQYDNRLRSLRQEHEKLKLQYETRAVIKPEIPVKSEGYTGRKMPTSSIKTLPNAMIKIRELEDEVEKVRTFYTKKIEDTQRKAEVQMRALKRGGVGVGGGGGGEVEGDGDRTTEAICYTYSHG